MRKMRKLGVLLVVVAALGMSSVAYGSSVVGGYGGQGSEPQVAVAPAKASSGVKQSTAGKLPFTGFEVGAGLALAVLLIGTGLVLRRTPRTND
jgi:hypothetical protein